MHQLVGEARRGVELAELLPGPGAQAGLLLELSTGGDVGLLLDAIVLDVEAAGGDLQQRRIRRQPPLAHERYAIVGVERDDGDRSRMPRDVTRRSGAVGAFDGVDAEFQEGAAVQDLRIDDVLDEIGPGVVLRGRGLAIG